MSRAIPTSPASQTPVLPRLGLADRHRCTTGPLGDLSAWISSTDPHRVRLLASWPRSALLAPLYPDDPKTTHELYAMSALRLSRRHARGVLRRAEFLSRTFVHRALSTGVVEDKAPTHQRPSSQRPSSQRSSSQRPRPAAPLDLTGAPFAIELAAVSIQLGAHSDAVDAARLRRWREPFESCRLLCRAATADPELAALFEELLPGWEGTISELCDLGHQLGIGAHVIHPEPIHPAAG